MKRLARLLIIAGSDSSGGAGIQADIKTASALGAYAMTAITAVTAQDTTGVHAIHPVPPAIVRAQILACLADIGADAIKTGMLGSAETVRIVAETLAEHARGMALVVDPVMTSSSGTALLDDDAVDVIKAKLLPLATLVTPNIPEFSRLAMSGFRGGAVLLTGGHGEGEVLVDRLFGSKGEELAQFKAARIKTAHTHGTGCTLSTAIACGLGQGLALADAVTRAHAFVQEAIRTAPGFGKGHGPLNHRHGAST